MTFTGEFSAVTRTVLLLSSFTRATELASEGTIGSVAATHYSFMGATDPIQMEPYARELAGRLKADAVDAVVLSPV